MFLSTRDEGMEAGSCIEQDETRAMEPWNLTRLYLAEPVISGRKRRAIACR